VSRFADHQWDGATPDADGHLQRIPYSVLRDLLRPLALEMRAAAPTSARRAEALREMAVLLPEARVHEFILLAVLVAAPDEAVDDDLLPVVPALRVLQGRCGSPGRPQVGEAFHEREKAAPFIASLDRALSTQLVFGDVAEVLLPAAVERLKFSPLACVGGGYDVAQTRYQVGDRWRDLIVVRLPSGEMVAAPAGEAKTYLYRCLGVEPGQLGGRRGLS
jgi:hypothetical protein